jgi:hypothetical protein
MPLDVAQAGEEHQAGAEQQPGQVTEVAVEIDRQRRLDPFSTAALRSTLAMPIESGTRQASAVAAWSRRFSITGLTTAPEPRGYIPCAPG